MSNALDLAVVFGTLDVAFYLVSACCSVVLATFMVLENKS